MSQTEIIISGFGGQGALFAGHALAAAAMAEDKHVTWLPSYGPEMRGGTAHVTTIIGDDPIGSPVVQRPQVVIALNKPSVAKYEPRVLQGGILIVNSTLVDEEPTREDISALMVPATEIAEEVGSTKLTNIVAVGALLALRPLVEIDSVIDAIGEMLGPDAGNLVEWNRSALARGWEIGEEAQKREGVKEYG